MTVSDLLNLREHISTVGSICQIGTALIAAVIGVFTYRYTKRQSALGLINQTNTLANLVNTTLIQSPQARDVLTRLQPSIVGSPDDAVLFLYLNYVHNTFRTRRIGAISGKVWSDTLDSCVTLVSGLERQQVTRLLARGYELEFQRAVLARYDEPRTTMLKLRLAA
jgi:hypothetical protein